MTAGAARRRPLALSLPTRRLLVEAGFVLALCGSAFLHLAQVLPIHVLAASIL